MNYKYWIKQMIIAFLMIFFIFLSFKFAIFYSPFLIAYIISLIVEPVIKKIANKCGFTRKTASIIVLILFFSLIVGIISWIIFSIFSEATNLLSGLNIFLEKAVDFISNIIKKIDINKFQNSEELRNLFQNSSIDLLNKIINFIRELLDSIINLIKDIPTFFIFFIITILATYFITSDKFYILDRMEHHLPHKWMKNIIKHSREITSSLGNYLKAEIIMIFISFIIVLIGLYIFYFIGMNIKYPILIAILIMIVDALPILGSGTVMIPWGIFEIINGDNGLGFSILGLYIITLVIKQLLEPKIVSNKIGIHPIFTLLAMYTGFKFLGIIGLLLGPIILIILKNVFEPFIEQGLLKSFFKID